MSLPGTKVCTDDDVAEFKALFAADPEVQMDEMVRGLCCIERCPVADGKDRDPEIAAALCALAIRGMHPLVLTSKSGMFDGKSNEVIAAFIHASPAVSPLEVFFMEAIDHRKQTILLLYELFIDMVSECDDDKVVDACLPGLQAVYNATLGSMEEDGGPKFMLHRIARRMRDGDDEDDPDEAPFV